MASSAARNVASLPRRRPAEVTGRGLSENALRRSIGLSAKTYCPAQGMLAKAMPMRLTYTICEGESVDDRTLVVEGEWVGE